MEKPEEKKQNNRKEDEKRHPDSKNNDKPNAKEWDPSKNKKDNSLNDKQKIEALKDVRKPKDANEQ